MLLPCDSVVPYSRKVFLVLTERRAFFMECPGGSICGLQAGSVLHPQKRGSSSARTRTGVATFRTNHLTFSATRFVRERQFGAAVDTVFQRKIRISLRDDESDR